MWLPHSTVHTSQEHVEKVLSGILSHTLFLGQYFLPELRIVDIDVGIGAFRGERHLLILEGTQRRSRGLLRTGLVNDNTRLPRKDFINVSIAELLGSRIVIVQDTIRALTQEKFEVLFVGVVHTTIAWIHLHTCVRSKWKDMHNSAKYHHCCQHGLIEAQLLRCTLEHLGFVCVARDETINGDILYTTLASKGRRELKNQALTYSVAQYDGHGLELGRPVEGSSRSRI